MLTIVTLQDILYSCSRDGPADKFVCKYSRGVVINNLVPHTFLLSLNCDLRFF